MIIMDMGKLKIHKEELASVHAGLIPHYYWEYGSFPKRGPFLSIHAAIMHYNDTKTTDPTLNLVKVDFKNKKRI